MVFGRLDVLNASSVYDIFNLQGTYQDVTLSQIEEHLYPNLPKTIPVCAYSICVIIKSSPFSFPKVLDNEVYAYSACCWFLMYFLS